MSDVAAMRSFNRELAAVVGATIEVSTKDGKTYQGTLKGIDQNTLSIILSDVVAVGESGNIPKIFIYGSSIVSFSVAQKEVSLEGLAKELEKTFPPGGVNFYPETGGGVIVVMNKIRITPEGVDGSGPLYERVREIAEDWLRDRGLI
ncbi:MAG: Lsm family RNA-binding protein [Candidatus Thorarchaeota archaeon]|nr:Lsm family RNA-binding protein [Candidatus Thorarchaeota archaeon]